MALARILLPALLCFGIAAASAGAAVVGIEGESILFTAAPGELNDVVIGQDEVPAGFFAIEDFDRDVTVRAPCRFMEASSVVICPTAGIRKAVITLGDGRDLLERFAGENNADLLPLEVDAGPGDDQVVAPDVAVRVVGGPGNDRLRGAIEDDVLLGGPGNDDLRGRAGADVIHGHRGSDNLFGDTGDDQLVPGRGVDFAGAGRGDDTVDWRNREKDVGRTSCASGRDTILQDRRDKIVEYDDNRDGVTTVLPSCERVRGQRAPAPNRVMQLRHRKARQLKLAIDLISAYGGRFTVAVSLPAREARRLGLGRRAVAVGTARVRHRKTRTRVVVGVPAKVWRALDGRSARARVRVRNVDRGGRRGTSTHRVKITRG